MLEIILWLVILGLFIGLLFVIAFGVFEPSAYQRGCDDWHDGIPIDSNPYKRGTAAYGDYIDGWNDTDRSEPWPPG